MGQNDCGSVITYAVRYIDLTVDAVLAPFGPNCLCVVRLLADIDFYSLGITPRAVILLSV